MYATNNLFIYMKWVNCVAHNYISIKVLLKLNKKNKCQKDEEEGEMAWRGRLGGLRRLHSK